MNRQTAKQLLKAWSRGAYASSSLIVEALAALMCAKPSAFVEECLARRQEFERRVGK